MNKSAGFTLIEVLIAMVLMVFISMAIFQTTTETFRLRDSLMAEGDFYNGIRLSLGILERDLGMVYSPVIMNPDQPDPKTQQDQAKAQEKISELNVLFGGIAERESEFWGRIVSKSGIRNSRFQGTDTRLSFITANHLRIYRETPESVFVKITYTLEDDPDATTSPELADTKMLVKTVNTNVFDVERDDKTYLKRYPLLHGIKAWKLTYYRKDKKSEERSWDTEKIETKDQFPDSVDLQLEVVGRRRMRFEGLYKFRLEVPLHGLAGTI